MCVCAASSVMGASKVSQVNRRGINVEFTPSGQGTKGLMCTSDAAADLQVCVCVCVLLSLCDSES